MKIFNTTFGRMLLFMALILILIGVNSVFESIIIEWALIGVSVIAAIVLIIEIVYAWINAIKEW